MVKQYKVDEVNNLVEKLKNKENFILTNYSGVNVKGLSDLRTKLREKDAEYKVVKNNLFKRALNEVGYEGIDDHLKGPVAVAFMGEAIGEVAKILKDFSVEQEAFSFSVAMLDKVVYSEEQVKQIAELPSREVILAQIMSMINAPTSGIAMGMNQIMASLARGINAVAEKNNN